jgi:hypothetical protein
MKGKPHKYGIKIYQLCEAKSGFVSNIEVYAGAHQTEEEYSTSFNAVNRLCDPIKNKWYTVHMDRFFSSPKIFDHMQIANTKAAGTVMPNQKEMPKELFPEKQKEKNGWRKETISLQSYGVIYKMFIYYAQPIKIKWLKHQHREEPIKRQNQVQSWIITNTKLVQINLTRCCRIILSKENR